MGTALMFLATVAGLFCTIGIGLLKDEAAAWLPVCSALILKFASRRLPFEKRERYLEEWSSHVAEYTGNLTRLYQSLKCLTASFGLAPASRRFKILLCTYFVGNTLNVICSTWIMVLFGADEADLFAGHIVEVCLLAVPVLAIAGLSTHYFIRNRLDARRVNRRA